MKEVPKIHHQEPEELKETLIKEPEPEEDEIQENTTKSNDGETSIETNETELLPEDLSSADEEEEIENEEVSEYKYLDDDVLNKEIMYDPEMNYQLHLCMYSMNLNTVKPFLFYYMLKKESYEFPKAFLDHSKFQKDEIGGTNEIKMKDEPFSILNLFSKSTSKEEEPEKVEDKEIDIQIIFEEQIVEYFKLVSQTKEEDVLTLYRGFLQEKEDIFLFFDVTNMDLPNIYTLELKNQYKFEKILIDEIINSKLVDNISVESQLVNIFMQHNELTQIKELNNEIVDLPIRGYICQEEEEAYLNTYYENKEEEITLINNKIYHKDFDYIYVFTDEPLVLDNLENIKSYALFVNKNVPIITESKEEIDLVKDNFEDYEIFYFMYNTKKYYGVNSKKYFQEI
tara:strand:+ start:1 stop:1194 length:1194 start_codon:yes stop_codon:yes gene_type:complete